MSTTLTKNQVKTYGPKPFPAYCKGAMIRATVRYDDQCGNGHNTFSITGEIYVPGRRDCEACGQITKEIKQAFPELVPVMKWHLCSSDGPMHYIANTVFLAGERDHWGLKKGEKRQMIAGRTKLPMWKLEAVNAKGVSISKTPTGEKYAAAETVPLYLVTDNAVGLSEASLPPVPVLRWVPCYDEGEGKARELDAARRTAIWPEATDEQLSAEPAELTRMLEERHPALMVEFQKAIESLGFVF